MVKREFVKEISERMSITQVEAKQFVKVFQDILTEELQQNRPLELQGFGTFSS
ncbi:MAG: HU family DNA-binding protein, partial [Parabacteroides sp.]|nr:HU family DNA-binding protein [Parabacteroides sp.]